MEGRADTCWRRVPDPREAAEFVSADRPLGHFDRRTIQQPIRFVFFGVEVLTLSDAERLLE